MFVIYRTGKILDYFFLVYLVSCNLGTHVIQGFQNEKMLMQISIIRNERTESEGCLYCQVAGLSRTGPALTDIQIRDKVKDVRRIDTEDRRTAGGLITVEVSSGGCNI